MPTLALLLSFRLVMPHAAASDPKILVFAAASLTESLQEIAAEFQKEAGTKVVFSVGSSRDLARQIAAGAPADAYFSADVASMDQLGQKGLVRASDRREFLSNALVIVVPADAKTAISSAADLAALPRLALADPESVPAGIYARKWLEGKGVWPQIAPKVVPTLDVRACLAAVEAGAAPAGIVYATDAAMAKRARVAYVIPDGPEILYSFAALSGGKNRAAGEAFLRFAEGPVGRAVFERRGFRFAAPKAH
jgi:molybdate transport system substrate-binding protein